MLRRPFVQTVLGVSAILALCLFVQGRQGVTANPVIESGTLTLYMMQNPIGEERYELKRSGDGSDLQLEASFEYTDRGTKIPMAASLQMRSDLTPKSFQIRGKSYRPFAVDAAVDIAGSKATVRDLDSKTEVNLPSRFFLVDGYSPLSVQMMLLRYWLKNGKPSRLLTLPSRAPDGEVKIQAAGQDSIQISGKTIRFDRYTIDNVIWGRESVWLDPQGRIAAATSSTGLLGFEAVRKEYMPALALFVKSAVADRMKDLGALTREVPPEQRDNFVIAGGALIDGTGRPAVRDSVVVIRNGRIAAAGPRGTVSIPPGLPVVDATGQTVLPGLWEMHGHYSQIEWGPAYLASGVTTARDMGGEFEFLAALLEHTEANHSLSPRLLLAGLIDGVGSGQFGGITADNPEKARELVARYKNAGFRQIKIYNLVKPDIVKVIAAEAHRLGMTVTGHVPNGMTGIQAVEAGYDQIAHMGGVAQAMRPAGSSAPIDFDGPEVKKAIQFFKDHATAFDTTMAWGEVAGHPLNIPFSNFEPGIAKAPYQLASLINTAGSASPNRPSAGPSEQQLVLRALIRAGILVVPGTDKGVPGHTLHRELELYVQAGLTPMEAIQAATSVAARMMSLDKEAGTIEAGKRADIILVSGNPLDNISDIRKVARVVTNGWMYDPARLWRSVGFRP